jgi:hypothetical protein
MVERNFQMTIAVELGFDMDDMGWGRRDAGGRASTFLSP